MKRISVVIPAIKFDQALDLCLTSLTYQKNVNLEVWVIFNPKIPDQEFSNWPPWIQFIESKKGVNCARNMGLKKSTADLVLFLDADCELTDPHHVEKILAFMGQSPGAAGVGGSYRISNHSSTANCAYHYLQTEWLTKQILGPDFQVRALLGGHMLLKKSLLMGLEFDENIIFGGSEKEFFCRLKKRNLSFYVNLDLSVLHHSDITRTQLGQKAKAQGLGEKYIKALHGSFEDLKSVYLKKPPIETAWIKDIDYYRQIFSIHSGRKSQKKLSLKSLLDRALEHLNVAQSNIN